MAHGIGYHWLPIWKVELKTDEYAVTFSRLYHYYYPYMSDCYEPTCEPTDEYKVCVMKWRPDPYNKRFRVADSISENVSTGSIDKDTANKIWWNIKNRNVSFEDCRKYFKELAGRELSC